MIVILMTLEVSFMFLENIYSTSVTLDRASYDDYNIFMVQATGDSYKSLKHFKPL